MRNQTVQTLKKMENRGFAVHAFETADEMRNFVLSSISDGQSVGFGGSMTSKQLGLYEALSGRGNPVYFHWMVPPEERPATIKNAHAADIYIMSSNAVTEDGVLINIDGNGNRIAAMLNGPKTVFILLGENKFSGDKHEALARVKATACPPNARRLGLDTPCAKLNRCTDCSSPQRMCNFTVYTERVPAGRTFHVCVVPEELGF